MFYDEKHRKEIEETIAKTGNHIKSASESSVLLIYDILALQMNELQRLNSTMESILSIIQLEIQNQ